MSSLDNFWGIMVEMEKTIYVTGITGFIGRNLLNELLKKFEKVVNFARNRRIQVYSAESFEDLEISTDFIAQNHSNKLINLATLYQPYPQNNLELQKLIEANIIFPSMVLKDLDGVKNLTIVNALSYHQLLDIYNQNIYSLSKEIFKRYLSSQDKKVINLYIFDSFGSGDTRNKVTDVFIKNILAFNAIKIPKNDVYINLSDGTAIANSIVESLKNTEGNYMIKSPDTLSLSSIAKLIMQISNIEVDIIRENTGTNYFDLLPELPQNIFTPPTGYSLLDSLEKRIQEIKNEK